MKFIVKYGIGLYLLATVLYKLLFLIPIAAVDALYYALMGFGVLIVAAYSKVIFSKQSIKVFWIFHLINLLNLTYFLLFDLGDMRSFFYLLAKFSTANLIIVGLIYNANFYEQLTVKYFKYIIFVILLLGLAFGEQPENSGGRLSIGFNPNDVGLFGLLGFFSIINFSLNWKKNKIDLGLLIFFLIVTLLSGSKAAILGTVFVVLIAYRISFKTVGLALVFSLSIILAGTFGFTTGVDRLLGKEKTFETRDEVFKNGMLTYMDNFTFGNGLDKYSWSNPKYFEDIELAFGPHNTYIGVGIMYGTVFGVVFLFLIFRFLWLHRKNIFLKTDPYLKYAYCFLLLIMVNGFSETLIVGVNEFVTVLYWFFIGVVALATAKKAKVRDVSGN